MDSVTQILLGASISVAVMGRRTAVWKAALWGGVAGLLPDLDVLLGHGDPILDMVRHRGETHAPLLLLLFAVPMAWMVSGVHQQRELFGRWWWALMLALVTHPLLDLTTIYGTQILQPFTDEAYGLGSMFIVDPVYSLPLLFGVVAALHYVPTVDNETNNAFVATYKEAQGKAPSEFTIQGYDAAKALMAAIDSGASDRASTAKALRGLKFDSPRGPVEIDAATNNIVHDVYIYETVKEGDGLTQKILGTIKAVRDEPNGCELD